MRPLMLDTLSTEDFLSPCPDCNGLGATGWGPTAQSCDRCGTLGYIQMPAIALPPAINPIDPELFEELFNEISPHQS